MTIDDILKKAQKENHDPSFNHDAGLLLAHALHQPIEYIYSHPERAVTDKENETFELFLAKRRSGYSVASIKGYKSFYGKQFIVNEDTLIPRPETELLVERALEYLKQHPRSNVVDIGTGSGNIIISIAAEFRHAQSYTAVDISPYALRVAEKNAHEHHVKIRFVCSNLMSDVPRKKYDLIVSNLPYLTAEQLAEPSIRREPIGALWGGGDDGTELYRELLAQLPPFCTAHALIILEIDPTQSETLRAIAREQFPNATIKVSPDLRSQDRMLEIQL